MEKVYECKSGTIFVTLPESCDRENLKKVTEDFLKKVIREGKKDDHSDTTNNFRQKQILHR